jgi:hypothetical protein
VETTASVLQDSTGKVVILCFRGTEPTNVITWLSDMAVEMERFYTWGDVHSGFLHGLLPVWPFLESALQAAYSGEPVRAGSIDTPGLRVGRPPPTGHAPELARVVAPQPGPSVQTLESGMEALYICGHSLGAALALLAAAMLCVKPECACIRKKLRGVYTFGTPKVGDPQFIQKCQDELGGLVFRHIYENDLITAMPPKLYGNFTTFGEEYVSTSEGWTHRRSRLETPVLLGSSVAVSVVGWALQLIPFLRDVKLPLSLHDHLPWNYVKCSRLSIPFYG